MLDGDDTLVASDEETHLPPSRHNISEQKEAPSDLLEDGEEVNLHGDSQPSRLRLGPSSDEVSEPLGGSTSSAPVMEPSFASLPDYTFIVKITDFEKRGDGIGAYLVYKVLTETRSVPGFSDRTVEVWRRFSDFLGLHEKLVSKFVSKGVVVPYPPEKSIAAMTVTKSAADPNTSSQVGLRRSRQLERFLARIVQHDKMRCDCDVRDFLTMEAELPKAVNTAALSSHGVKKIFKQVGEVFSRMAFHMEEGDRWFEQTQSHFEELEESLRKLLTLSEELQTQRKELAHCGENMSKALSMLASCEESTALARALSHLTETEENCASAYGRQADADQAILVEGVREYVELFHAMKDVFNERVHVWQNWQSAQQNLAKKREQKARLELSGKADKAQQMKDEIDEAINKMDALEAEFAQLSKLIREEVTGFEKRRRDDLNQLLIKYLESLVETQTEILKLWERFVPETQSITA